MQKACGEEVGQGSGSREASVPRRDSPCSQVSPQVQTLGERPESTPVHASPAWWERDGRGVSVYSPQSARRPPWTRRSRRLWADSRLQHE